MPSGNRRGRRHVRPSSDDVRLRRATFARDRGAKVGGVDGTRTRDLRRDRPEIVLDCSGSVTMLRHALPVRERLHQLPIVAANGLRFT